MMAAPSGGGSLIGVASIDAIIRFARSAPVFPCRAVTSETIVNGKPKTLRAKAPHIPEGFLKASQDEQQIRAWWKRWPDALVGVPMGQATGLVAVDYDPGKHADATGEWLELHADALMAARIHSTMRAGRHYVYRIGKGQRYRTGSDLTLDGKPRPGIDLRAEGGYIIWWPLHGGTVTNDEAPLLPAGLIDERSFALQPDIPEPRKAPSPAAWEKDRQAVMAALAYLDPADRDRWIRTGMALHLATGGNDEGFDLWHTWSAGGITGDVPASYGGIDDCRYHWASFKDTTGKPVTLGSLFHEAKAAGYAPRRPEPPPVDDGWATEDSAPAAASPEATGAPAADTYRRPMQWAKLEQEKPPERTWRIKHWLTVGPTLMAGQGGIGKTLMAQTIATALVLGRDFIDQIEEPCKVLFWACEDEHDELWRRQIAICEYFGVNMADLEGKLIIEPRLGCDNALFTQVFGKPAWTPLKDELASQVHDYGADVLFLDNIAQTYGGNENDRHHVTTFINGLIGLDSAKAFTPILLGHPSRATGSEFSGSSAWENAVRMRWYMGTALPDQKEGEAEEGDPNVRYFSKRKTNYSVKDYRKLVYENGVFVPEISAQEMTQKYGYRARVDGAINIVVAAVRKFNTMNIRVVDAYNSPDYLIRKMQQMKLLQDYTPKELADAMAGLRLQGRLIEVQVGQKGNRTKQFGLTVADYFAAREESE